MFIIYIKKKKRNNKLMFRRFVWYKSDGRMGLINIYGEREWWVFKFWCLLKILLEFYRVIINDLIK